MALSPSGALTGAAGKIGTYKFTVTVSDGGGLSTSKAFAWVVKAGPLSVVTASLGSPRHGHAYKVYMTAKGGTGTFTWAFHKGSMPAGMGISKTGAFYGTPKAAGIYKFYVQVTDSAKRTVYKYFRIVVR